MQEIPEFDLYDEIYGSERRCDRGVINSCSGVNVLDPLFNIILIQCIYLNDVTLK